MRVELPQIFDSLPKPDEPHRDAELPRDTYDYSAFGRAVEFREYRPGEINRFAENFRLAERILPRRRIKPQPNLMWRPRQLARDDAANLLQLLHQIGLGLQPPRSID